MRGPISLCGSKDSPTLICEVFSFNSSIKGCWIFPIGIATDVAIHRSPAEPKAAPIRPFTASSKLASSIISM